MMKSNPNVYPLKSNKSPRNGFDMSYHSYFTSPTGMLLPAYVQDVTPGDFLKLDVSNFTRTLPVNTASFARIKEKMDFFFVPYRLIWRWFDQFYTNVKDMTTAYSPVDAATTPKSIPYLLGSDIFGTSGLSNPGNDDFGYLKANYLERVLDLLGYPVNPGDATKTNQLYGGASPAGTFKNTKFNPFRIFALSRIYYEFYRQTDYESNSPLSYNLDNCASDGSAAANFAAFMNNMVAHPYKNWSKDKLTNLKPSINYSEFGSVNSYVPGSTVGIFSGDGQVSGVSGYVASASAGSPTQFLSFIQNTQGLRNALAVDKLARISQLAPKTYAAQMKAHFGVDPDNCDYCSCRFLGSFDSDVVINEVIASAAGSDGTGSTSSVGEIYGRGVSSGKSNRVIKAQFNEPGIVMGIHYTQPVAEYNSNRIDLFNRKLTRQDYFVPEYDSLGLQPVLRMDAAVEPDATLNTNNDVLGYGPRYNEYKSRLDEVHCNFQSGGNLKAWTIPRSIQLSGVAVSKSLKIDPHVTNSIFSAIYDGTKNTDSYLHHFLFKAQMSRNMSIYGLPTF